MISREESNPDGKCVRYAYDFMRDVISGRSDPKTMTKVHWYCLHLFQRVYNLDFTYDNKRRFYPRYNELIPHGRRCPANEAVGWCKCKAWLKLVDNERFFLRSCATCEGENSPLYRQF